MKNNDLSGIKDIQPALLQNVTATILTLICMFAATYLVLFNEGGWSANKDLIFAFMGLAVVSKIMSAIAGKEVDEFLEKNPDLKEQIDNIG